MFFLVVQVASLSEPVFAVDAAAKPLQSLGNTIDLVLAHFVFSMNAVVCLQRFRNWKPGQEHEVLVEVTVMV